MSNPLVRAIIRTKFQLTSREKASQIIRTKANAYLSLAKRMKEEQGAASVTVPAMIGVDPDMRSWSFFQILEHNAIVNRSIAAIVKALALGEEPSGAALINPKTDVLPKGVSGPEQITAFKSSVDDYLSDLAALQTLRATSERPHPIFGSFDAHQWHCMFGFHLNLHLRQAEKVISYLGR